jgi:molecular chaperone GrpE
MDEKDNQADENTIESSAAVDCGVSSEEQIQKLKEEISLLQDNLLRKAAESENLRKRLEKEKEDAIKYSNTKFAKDLLATLDNFERAMENSVSMEEKIKTNVDFKAFFDGILLCEKEILSTFKKHGISRTEVKEGDEFNPEFHMAMCELESSDHKAGTVIKVFQTGYICNDRLLRPAMVSVSRKT